VVDLMYDGQRADAWSVGVILFILVAGFPPFESSDSTSKWFCYLLEHGHAAFFDLHRRFGAAFSPQLQDLLTRLLQVDPSSRLRVEMILQHPWLAGAQLSPQALQLEMQGRLHTLRSPRAVREAARQAQARAEQQAQQAQLQQQQQRLDQQHNAVTGNLQCSASSSEERGAMQPPPLAPPSLAAASLHLAAPRPRRGRIEDRSPTTLPPRSSQHSPPRWQEERKEQVATSASPLAAFAFHSRAVLQPAPCRSLTVRSSSEAATAEAKPPLPVYDPELTLPALTPLFSRLPAAELQQKLRTLLLLNCFSTASDDKQRSITASIGTPSGLVRLRLQLWREVGEQENGSIRIEFRRLEGDSAQCRQLFADLLLQMDDIVDC
jgi:type II secretory pathway pseudopilin PulG